MPHSRAPSILFPVNERQCVGGHWAKQPGSLGQAWGVIGPTKGGHWANANERHSMTLAPDRSLWKSIELKEGGHWAKQRGGAPVSWPTGSGDCQVVARLRATTRFRRRNSLALY